MAFRSELKQARAGCVATVDMGAVAPGNSVCSVGVDATLPYRRIYGAFVGVNVAWNVRIQFRGLFQGQERFLFEGNWNTAGSEVYDNAKVAPLRTPGWLPYSVETQPTGMGLLPNASAPAAHCLRYPFLWGDNLETEVFWVTCYPYDTVGVWDKIEARIIPNSGNGFSGASATSFAEVFIACHSSTLR
jgi:hypothetical protein